MSSSNHPLDDFFLSDVPERVSAASAALVHPNGELGLSSGVIRKPDGINTRTQRPERDGVFCAVVFGPIEDFHCNCGKYVGQQHDGVRCEKCGVLCILSSVRKERWGHLLLPTPVIHPVLAPKVASVFRCKVDELRSKVFEGELQDEAHRLPSSLLRVVEARWLITQIPVTPAGLRGRLRDAQDQTLIKLINRSNRLRRLMELNAPEIILVNEERMQQEAFESYFEAVRTELLATRSHQVPKQTSDETDHLLKAVLDAPQDDAHREAYAEHLKTLGYPRGEFISLQLQTKTGGGVSRKGPEGQLLRRHLDEFLVPFNDVVVHPTVFFRKGFLAACRVRDDAVESMIGDPNWATVEKIETNRADLIVSPTMRSLRSIVTRSNVFAKLCQHEHPLPSITEAEVRMGMRFPEHREIVAHAEAFSALTRLTLVHQPRRTPPDWNWLVSSPLAARLSELTTEQSLEGLGSFSLPFWVDFTVAHPHLSKLKLDLGKGYVVFELSRQGGQIKVRLRISQGFAERVVMWNGEGEDSPLRQQLIRACQGIDAHRLAVLDVRGNPTWTEELEKLFAHIGEEYGAITLR
jgi:uncharacterized protein (TIGR02996 family)